MVYEGIRRVTVYTYSVSMTGNYENLFTYAV